MELRRWKEHLGIAIVIQPKHFPVDAGAAAHLIAAAPEERAGWISSTGRWPSKVPPDGPVAQPVRAGDS